MLECSGSVGYCCFSFPHRAKYGGRLFTLPEGIYSSVYVGCKYLKALLHVKHYKTRWHCTVSLLMQRAWCCHFMVPVVLLDEFFFTKNYLLIYF